MLRNSIPHSSLTCTLKCGFLATGNQRLSSAHLLWLKLLMKNKWCNHGIPLPSIHMLDSRVAAPFPLLVGLSGLYRWGARSTRFLHHKLNGNTHIQIPVQYQVFRKRGFPQRWSVCFQRVPHFTMDDETWNMKQKLCETVEKHNSAFSEMSKLQQCLWSKAALASPTELLF